VGDEYYCDDHSAGVCRRGFFSLFIQVLYGISFAKKHNLPYYVDFGNTIYPYSKQTCITEETNFWNYYFFQPELASEQVKVYNLKYETYPIRVWNKGYLSQVYRHAVRELEFSENMKLEIQDIEKQFSSKKVLGVHIRMTDHHLEVTPAGDCAYFSAIDKYLKRFDQLFVATDDDNMLEILKERYPDKISFHPFLRSRGSTPLHGHPVYTDGYTIGREALLDCYSLACCQMAILSPSNFSYAVLLLNPTLAYHLVESSQAAFSRRKTLAAYYLNKWGIRKW
jgi:hypothetical protein